jgi:8-oxo-dGTP diphosphatase
MPLARFVAIHAAPEADAARQWTPSFAVSLVCGPRGVVLVYNRYRQVWELPGGLIDPGETWRDAARRELLEEAGCAAEALEWLGIVEVDDGRRHFGAAFAGVVACVPDHVSNEEIGGIAAWSLDAAPQPLGATDRALLERFARTGLLKRA